MSTVEPLPDNIRRIAVLVSSVDSATARQLLLHLPTSVAKKVRSALQNLGPVTPSERQRILTEFQLTAAKQNQTSPAIAPAATPVSINSASKLSQNPDHSLQSAGSVAADPYAQARNYAPSLAEHSERDTSSLYSMPPNSILPNASGDASQPSWKWMDIRALSHFLRGERATVIAVVINQLSPNTGVSLIQQLPTAMHREVLQAIASLQDIDEEAMQSIEEHLAERLKDYEQQVNGEAKGTRRVAALLAAAPPELQESWSRFVHIAIDSSNETLPVTEPIPKLQSAPDSKEIKQNNFTSTANHPASVETTFAPRSPTSELKSLAAAPPIEGSLIDDNPYILPFPGSNDGIQSNPGPLSDVDRSLIQIEFEQILSLSTHELAQILTASNSNTVLLALAGASPSFMKRFYSMLTKADGKALAQRLSKIGPLNLRDIDEAQRSIAELAAKLMSPRSHRTSHSQSLRVAS